MMPIAPLMIEHRLIERMIALMGKETQRINDGSAPDTALIGAAVDFIRIYADHLHHGKEEKILFDTLSRKPLSPEHKRIMDELLKEHVFGRETIRRLEEARGRYVKGEKDARGSILDAMTALVTLYPKHIEKEDRHFFLPVMSYLAGDEQASMLAEFNDFDRQFIHAEYKDIVSAWEKK